VNEQAQLAALHRVHELLTELGIDYWLFGGWAVDFYAGSITRAHDDVDIAVWLADHGRIAELLTSDGWRHAPQEGEDGGTGYERDGVRLELTFLVRDENGDVFIPFHNGRAAWAREAFGEAAGELDGVRAHLIDRNVLLRGKSTARADPDDAAKDDADARMLTEPQLAPLVDGLRRTLGDRLVGVYVHGSAVLGGLRPRSDIDVIAVSTHRTKEDEKRALVELLLRLSRRPRPIELEVVVHSEIRPWRYPPPFDFHYSETWRPHFEAGELEPWSRRTNPDLAAVVTMTLAGNTTLAGPPPAEIFDPVPRADYVASVLRDLDDVQYLDRYTRNVVLTLPRVWSAIATDDVHSKESAAAWALPRLPEQHRPVLARALAVYRGEADEPAWDLEQVRAYADYVAGEIERAT
jgi:streptomycin 3"-adenylyltransferase